MLEIWIFVFLQCGMEKWDFWIICTMIYWFGTLLPTAYNFSFQLSIFIGCFELGSKSSNDCTNNVKVPNFFPTVFLCSICYVLWWRQCRDSTAAALQLLLWSISGWTHEALNYVDWNWEDNGGILLCRYGVECLKWRMIFFEETVSNFGKSTFQHTRHS